MEALATIHGRNFNFHPTDASNKRGAKRKLALIAAAVLAAGCMAASAATLPAGFSESVVASGLSSPTAMEFAPDGRLFVCQQGGALRVIENGTLLTTPFMTLTTIDATAGTERGLLGIAFDPNFATNRWLYVFYTFPDDPGTTTVNERRSRVSRFTASASNPNVRDTSVPEFVVADLDPLSATNHNGGAIHFGGDGKLYVATG